MTLRNKLQQNCGKHALLDSCQLERTENTSMPAHNDN